MLTSSEGILVGCDQKQEWLLPWWWSHFYPKNPHTSVAFADFGMTEKGRDWCRANGSLIAVPEAPLAEKVDPGTFSLWEKIWRGSGMKGDLGSLRKIWFKKPIAMSASPFSRTVWIDIDCEVRKSLEPLFYLPLSSAKFAAVSMVAMNDMGGRVPPFPHYSAGVVIFEKESPLLNLWISAIPEGSQAMRTEEDLLAYLIASFKTEIHPLPPECNWEIERFGPNRDAFIYHWMGEKGKEAIRRTIASKSLGKSRSV